MAEPGVEDGRVAPPVVGEVLGVGQVGPEAGPMEPDGEESEGVGDDQGEEGEVIDGPDAEATAEEEAAQEAGLMAVAEDDGRDEEA